MSYTPFTLSNSLLYDVDMVYDDAGRRNIPASLWFPKTIGGQKIWVCTSDENPYPIDNKNTGEPPVNEFFSDEYGSFPGEWSTSQTCTHVSITNDGTNDLEVEISNVWFLIKSKETFTNNFLPFDKVYVGGVNPTFRCILK